MQRTAEGRAPAGTAIRMASCGGGGALLASGLFLLTEAPTLDRPGLVVFTALLTLLVGVLVLVAGTLLLRGRRRWALGILTFALLYTVLLPTLRYTPEVVRVIYLMELGPLFPPLWPFSVALPILAFLLFDSVVPRRGYAEVGIAPHLLVMGASVVFLYFASAMSTEMIHTLIRGPWMMVNAYVVSVAVSWAMVLGLVLARRGYLVLGALLLIALGVGVEYGSTLFYQAIPRYLDPFREAQVWHLIPWVPTVGATLPGAVSALAGGLLLWRALGGAPVADAPPASEGGVA